jgi:hypothetical protein
MPSSPPPALTPEPTWAPRWPAVEADRRAGRGTVRGAAAGAARIRYRGRGDVPRIRIRYKGFSDDGIRVIDGTERTEHGPAQTAVYEADLQLSGCHTGYLRGRLELPLVPGGRPPAGTMTSAVDGNVLTGPPALR